MQQANAALQLSGPTNVRDLGGYPTLDGKRIRFHQFLRGDNPSVLTASDREILYSYGVRAQIDLRSDVECNRQPSPLQGFQDVSYLNIPLMDSLNANISREDFRNLKMPSTMLPTYLDLLDKAQESFAAIFRQILRFPKECVLFNCTAGKDRTGMVAMLLLKLAHCADEVIVADYAASYANIRQAVEKMLAMYKAQGLQLEAALFRSDPELMEETLAHLDKAYGSVEAWMEKAGLSTTEVAALQHKLAG